MDEDKPATSSPTAAEQKQETKQAPSALNTGNAKTPAPVEAPKQAGTTAPVQAPKQTETTATTPKTKGIVGMWNFMDEFTNQDIIFDTTDEAAGKWAAEDVTGYNTFRFTEKDEQIVLAEMKTKMVGESAKLAATFIRATAPAGMANDAGTWLSADLEVFGRSVNTNNTSMTKSKVFGNVKYTVAADASNGGSVTITAEVAN